VVNKTVKGLSALRVPAMKEISCILHNRGLLITTFKASVLDESHT